MSSCARIYVYFIAVAFSLNAGAQTSLPDTFTIEGRLYDNTVTPAVPYTGNVDVQFEVYVEGNPNCPVYRETFSNQNVGASDGIFSFPLGSGTPDYIAGASLTATFSNSTALIGESTSDGDNVADSGTCTIAASSGAHRFVRILVRPAGVGSLTALNIPVQITSVPHAMVAETLQGMGPANFVQVRDDATTDLTQVNLEALFNTANFSRLQQLLSPSAAVGFGSQRLTNVADPSAAQDAATKNYTDTNLAGQDIDLDDVAPGTGDGKVLAWDAASATWMAQTPVATDATKLPLDGSQAMAGALNMGGYDVLATGHITMSPTKTINLGIFDNTQETALVATLTAAHEGAFWFNSQDNVLKVWSGSAAITQAHLTAGKLGSSMIPDTAVNAAVYGSATHVPRITVGADGRLTLASEVAISGVAPAGAAGGDLSGTYPNPEIAPAAVGNLEIAANAITSAKINNVGNAVNRLLITDATTGANVTYATCADDQILKYTATGWACATVASLAPVTTVAGRGGDVVLTAADISNLGSAALEDVGTAAGELVQLDAGAKIAAALLPDTTELQGRPVAATGPAANEALVWNGTAWAPAAVTATGAASGDLAGNYPGPTIAASAVTTAKINDSAVTTAKIADSAVTDAKIAGVSVNKISSAVGQYFTYQPNGSQCAAAQILSWDDTNDRWVCSNVGGMLGVGDISQVETDTTTGLLGGGSSGGLTLSIDVGTADGQIVQLEAGGKLPAIDGSDLTAVRAVSLHAYPVQNAAPTSGQLLKWDTVDSRWEPSTLVAADIPDLDAGKITAGILPITRGGTGSATGSITGSGALEFQAGGTNQNIVLTPSGTGQTIVNGNVGIGTTNAAGLLHVRGTSSARLEKRIPSSAAIQEALTLAGTYSGADEPDAGFGVSLNFALEGDTKSALPVAARITTQWDAGQSNNASSRDADLSFHTAEDGAVTERMRLTSDGNVGIGTSNPSSKLHVNGIVTATGFSGPMNAGSITNNSAITISSDHDNTGSDGGINFNSGGVTRGQLNPAGNFIFDSTTLVIDSANNRVGIGTASPGVTLDVAHSMAANSGSSNVGARLQSVWSPASSLAPNSELSGTVNTVNTTGSAGMDNGRLIANNNLARHSNTSTLGNLISGNYAVVNSSTGNVTNATGLNVSVSNASGGTITNAYGVYIGQLQGANKYGVYQEDDTAHNFFAGSVGIGTFPEVSLDLGSKTDAIRIPNGLTSPDRPATPANGMIRYNTTLAKIEAYEDGVWKNMIGAGGGGGGDFTADGLVPMTGQFQGSAGTAALPGITFDGNESTGFYSHSAGNIGISSNGAQSGIISADGAIFGISSSNAEVRSQGSNSGSFSAGRAFTPTAAGQLIGTFGFTTDAVFTGGLRGVTTEAHTATNRGTALTLLTTPNSTSTAVERIRVNHNGNVGIGITAPTEKLDVFGFVNSSSGYKTNSSGYGFRHQNGAVTFSTFMGGGYEMGMESAHKLSFMTSSLERMTLLANGNVGIGATNPTSALVVGGNANAATEITVQNPNAGNAAQAALKLSTDTGFTSLVSRSSGAGDSFSLDHMGAGGIRVRQLDTSGSITFSTSSPTLAERLRIANTGSVGIGTTDPRAALDVTGAIVSAPAVNNGAATGINFATGNIQYTTASCGSFVLNNLKDGGTYTFVVKGGASTACSFTAYHGLTLNPLVVRPAGTFGPTVGSSHTIFNFMVVGSDVYVTWQSGL